MNGMLLCKNCVEQNERDNFIRSRTLAKAAEKIDSLDVGEKLKSIERRLKELDDEITGNATKTMCDNVEKTYVVVVAIKTTTGVKNGENSKRHNINKSIGIQGITEDPNKTKGENLVSTNSKYRFARFDWCECTCHGNTKSWKISKGYKKPRAVLVPLANEHEAKNHSCKESRIQKLFSRKKHVHPASVDEGWRT